MKTYFTETFDKRAARFLILDEAGKILKATNDTKEIEGLTEATKNQSILACYEKNIEVGNCYFVTGKKIDGALTEATKAFI